MPSPPRDDFARDPDRRTPRRRTGDAAEAATARFLVARGLVPLERQYLRRIGEIDLVLVDPSDGTIVFVEVRYRSDPRRGGATGSVDAAKRRRLRRTAAAWLQRHADPLRPARIDVVGLSPARDDAAAHPVGWEGYAVEWVKNAVTG